MNQNHQHYQGADLDDRTDISPLPCGSIVPNKEYDPSRNPIHQPFVLPLEIVFKEKIEVVEWLRLDNIDSPKQPFLNPVSPAQSDRKSFHNEFLRQGSWDSRLVELGNHAEADKSPPMVLHRIYPPHQKTSHEPFRCAESTASGDTLNTSPTDLSGLEGEPPGLEFIVHQRTSTDTKRFRGIFKAFHKRRKYVRLRRSRGCLT